MTEQRIEACAATEEGVGAGGECGARSASPSITLATGV